MTDIFIPPWLNVASVSYSPVEQVGVSQSPFGGFPRTATLASGRMRARMEFTAVGGSQTQSERGSLIATLVRAGRSNRVVFGDPGFRIRGSFPASEIVSNNTFANGTTGFNASGSPAVFTVSDRCLMVIRSAGGGANPQVRQTVTVTQYAPYAARAMMLTGRGSQALTIFLGDAGGANSQMPGPGITTAVLVAPSTSLDIAAFDAIASGGIAGDYFEVPYMSLSRCALVDAGVNLLLRSDEFDNASWTKTECTITANAGAAPDGTSTADSLVDNTNNATHFVQQAATVSSAAGDFQISVAVKAGARNFVILQILTASGSAFVYFDLTSGASSTLTLAGTSFSNPRASAAVNLGNGWLRVCLVARKISSETLITALVYAANSGSSPTYAGATTSAILIWRATMSTSGVPARLVQTTSVATSGESQLANGLRLKGLLASTNGLLLVGDAVEIITARGGEYKIVTAALNSDASGLGYLQFAPALRFSPSDNAAVIIQQPMGRFISLSDAESWNTDPGIITTAPGDFIEA